MKRDLHAAEVYEECLARIARITPETPRVWGRMDAAQMFSHCAEVQEVLDGKALVGTPWFLAPFGGLMRRFLLSERPFPEGARTHPQYEESGPRDFETQRTRLLTVLQSFAPDSGPPGIRRHPLFGPLAPRDAGWLSYKHLDHHLRQFGV